MPKNLVALESEQWSLIMATLTQEGDIYLKKMNEAKTEAGKEKNRDIFIKYNDIRFEIWEQLRGR